MKKALYIALAVQSLVLLGVVGALVYSVAVSGRAPVEDGSSGGELDGGPETELAALEAPVEERVDPSDAGRSGSASTERDAGEARAVRPPADEPQPDPGAVVSELVAGNERFARGDVRLRDALAVRRSPGRPKALVLGCSDAVVPVEQVFDQPLGSLVVVRTAAQWVDEGVAAAVDDALTRQQVRVVVVLGHRGCPTVGAALHGPSRGEPALSAKLRPVLSASKGQPDEAKAGEAIVSWAVTRLAQQSRALRAVRPTVLRALYDEGTGEVQWLDAEANPGKAEAARKSADTLR